MYKVKEIADFAGVSARTLHHYDRIGLLKPAHVTESGYRMYDYKNLERLQQILFFKELEFSLEEIAEILDNPNFDRKKQLREQKKLLKEKMDRLSKIISSIDHSLQAIDQGDELGAADLFTGLSMEEIKFNQNKYRDEVIKNYGKRIYELSEQNTAILKEEDWKRIQAETDSIFNHIIERMEYGPADSQVQEYIDKWRSLINEHFYECSIEVFRGLGNLYSKDERFINQFDRYKKGLSFFLKEAIDIYCKK